jgi:hypothetical protein
MNRRSEAPSQSNRSGDLAEQRNHWAEHAQRTARTT